METLRLLASQRDRRAVDPELEWIAPERSAQESHLGTLDEAEHHEALHGSIGSLNGIDADAIAGL